MKVSIIIPTYNHKNFIAETIESILAQTYCDWELLIGDDSPNIESRKIIKEYTKKYPKKIKAWHHNINKWIVGNINFLISKSSSDSSYIAFLEWDDLYTPDNLDQKIHIFNSHGDVKLVYNDLNFINEKSKIILESLFAYRNISFYQNQIIPSDIFVLCWIWPIVSRSSCMIKKEILKYQSVFIRNIIPEKKTYSVSDRDFYFQVATSYKVYGIKKPLTQYRRHANNLSRSDRWTSDDLQLLMKYYLQNNIIEEHLYNKKTSRIEIVSCVFSLENWLYKASLNHFYLSIKSDTFWFLIRKFSCLILLCLPWFIRRVLLNFLIRRS